MVTIVSGGTSSYSIVVSDAATVIEQTAATELQTYLQKVSGALLPIVTEASAPVQALMIGPTAFATANGITPTGGEQWAIKVIGQRIVLAGGRPRGVLYAAFHFIEDQLGVRWWNPWEENVPSTPTVAISDTLNVGGTPGFGYRDIYDGCYDSGINFTGTQPYSLFYVRNRLNGHFAFPPASYGGAISYGFPYHAHTFSLYFPPEQYFDLHPEYYSLISGARSRFAQICLTDVDVISLMKQKVRASIAASYSNADAKGLPRPKIFSLTPNDWRGFCEHPPCQAARNAHGDSGYLLSFVNEIAADIATTYPEVVLDTFAYWFYVDPPVGVVPASNVQIRYANISHDILHGLSHANNAQVRTKLEAWRTIAPAVVFWNYGVNYYPNPPLAAAKYHQGDEQYLRNQGVTGVFSEVEGTVTSDMWDMNFWVQAKFLENPDLNLTTTLQSFTAGYYGAAGPFIDNHLDLTNQLLASTNNIATFGTGKEVYTFVTLAYVNSASTNFNQAAAAVSSNATYMRRVNHARASLDRLILFQWSALQSESQSTSTAMNFDRKSSAARYTATMKTMKGLRSLATSATQPYNDQAVDDEIRTLTLPTDLGAVPYRSMSDSQADGFRLWTANGGVALSDDPTSIVGRAATVTQAAINTQAIRDSNTPPVQIGAYNPVDGARVLRSLSATDITPNVYKLYPCGSALLHQADYIYLLRSWMIQLDVASLIAGKPNQMYDVYVSANFQGPSFGGSAGDPDFIAVDRIVLVAKGPLPAALSSVAPDRTTDFSPESFRLYTGSGGVSSGEDASSLVLRSAKITLSRFATEVDRDYHLVTATLPLFLGLYNPTNGARVIQQFYPADLVLNQFKVYSALNVLPNPGDYLYLFRSWNIQCDVFHAFTSDLTQRYDIHVSMKFQGPAYGGALGLEDAVFVDRVIVVRR